MKGRGFGSSFLMMILSGLAVGALGLIEPLARFWGSFHLLGLPWTDVLLLYLGIGLFAGLASGIPLYVILSLRSMERRAVVIASYYAMGALALGIVVFTAPLIRHELIALLFPVSYAIIYPVLILFAALVTLKLTPHVMRPLLSGLVGMPSGRISSLHLIVLLVVIGSLLPITAFQDYSSRYEGSGHPPREENRTRPSDDPVQNVLFITIDALRADHLSCYGYRRHTSPLLDSLATRSMVFEHCFAQGSHAELSLGSIFTSLYPSMHAVRHTKNRASVLAKEIETLAERLRDAGLRTACLASNPYAKREWGLAQGFDRLEEFHFGYLDLIAYRYLLRLGLAEEPNRVPWMPIPRAELVVDRAIEELDRLREDPFFLYLHLMDTHHPFMPPRPFRFLFRTPHGPSQDLDDFWAGTWPVLKQLPSDPRALSPDHLQEIVDLYDGAIRYTDHHLGRLFKALEEKGLRESTLIIVTSEQGNEFMEHGQIFQRSEFLYDELIHVPLIMSWPSQPQGERIADQVRHIDLLPTLMEVYGQQKSRQATGISLMPMMTSAPPDTTLPVFSQSYEFLALRTPGHKLMHDLESGDSYCFDLVADPNEETNCMGSETCAPCDSLMPRLMDFLRRVSLPPEGRERPEIDEKTRRQFQSLGDS